MYVIFPLEDLLDPNSGLSRRLVEQPQSLPENNGNTEQVCPPSPLPNHTILPNQPPTQTQTLLEPSASPAITLTASVARSGSVIKSASVISGTPASPNQHVQAKQQQQQQQQGVQPPVNKVLQGSHANLTSTTNASAQQQKIQQQQHPQQQVKKQTQIVPQSKQQTQTQPKSQSFTSLTVPTNNRVQTTINVTPTSSACNRLIATTCDTLSATVTNQPLINRNSWPGNTDFRPPSQANVVRSSSDRKKEPIRPSVPQDNVSAPQGENATLPRRKTALLDPSGLPKDLVIKQKTPFTGAKDGSISAKEFNHNVSGSDVTIGSKESSSPIISPIGLGSRTGGLIRDNSFSSRDRTSKGAANRGNRSVFRASGSAEVENLPSDTTATSTLAGGIVGVGGILGGAATSGRSSNSSAKSKGSGGAASDGRIAAAAAVRPIDPKLTSHGGLRTDHSRTMMAFGGAGDAGLRQLTHPALNEPLKAHSNTTFKLLKTVSEFSAQLSRLHEHHGEQLQHLVHTFRKKNSELRNERPTPGGPVAIAWESLLQEVEVDSQLHVDIAATLTRDVARPLVENTFYRKLEARKVFAHRESFDAIINKAEEQLKKHKREYTEAYRTHCALVTNGSLSAHLDSHNNYVTQLRATNGMLTEYHTNALPALLQELEGVLTDVGNIASSCIQQAADIIANKTGEQHQRYDALSRNCHNVDGRGDVNHIVKNLDIPHPPRPLHRFSPPQLPQPPEGDEGHEVPQEIPQPTYHNEMVEDRLADFSCRSRVESLSRETSELTRQIQQNQESHESLVRGQQRSLEAGLHNKANELQEDISLKRFDIRVAQLHLGAVKAQKELFSPREGSGGDGRERKMSSSSTGSMKSKWMKAFKSLKTPSSSSSNPPKEASDRRTGGRGGELSPPILENSHLFQEYTYKKISACDVCHQILKGHSRQGLKCKLCKVNVHPDCQGEAPRCQPKSRLLRRQRSTSEIETKHIEIDEEECEPNMSFNSLIASQPGRRTLMEPPSPTGQGPHDHGKRVL